MELDDLGSHGGSKLGIQIGQRLVEQEDIRISHHRSTQGDALLLSTREVLGAAGKQIFDAKYRGDVPDLSLDALSGVFRSRRAKDMFSFTLICG